MKTFEEVIEKLNKDLDTSRVSYREGSWNEVVPYLEGHDVINQANSIFDYRWSFKIGEPSITQWNKVITRFDQDQRKRVPVVDKNGNPVTETTGLVYVTGEVQVVIGDEVYSHGDLGRSIITSDAAEALDMAIAGAATDCLKRCFRQLGNQFGIQLYDKEYRHDNLTEAAGEKLKEIQSNRGGGNNKPVNKPANKPAAKPATSKPVASKEKEETAPAPKPPAEVPAEVTVALDTVVPDGIPMAGKKFSDIYTDKLGKGVLRWLTGEEPNRGGAYYKPEHEDVKIQATAKLVVDFFSLR